MCAGLALIVSACGSGGSGSVAVAQPPAPIPAAAVAAPAATTTTGPTGTTAVTAGSAGAKAPTTGRNNGGVGSTTTGKAGAGTAASAVGATNGNAAIDPLSEIAADSSAVNQKVSDEKHGATDIGVTKDSIKLGSINMHGMALGNLATLPMVRGNAAAAAAINDRGGVLGRRLTITDCDDGPGEVSRAKSCLKKLVDEDRIFSMITGVDWATGSIHDDLTQYHLPYIGAWAYSQTEWQDPFMFPTHMSMIHEAMAGGHWVVNVIRPKTYGLVCLTSPEMQLACNNVAKIVDASGAKLVKRADVSISETSMSAYVLAMRAANPEHVIHYVINPATIVKFMTEATQQGYYPPKGISGNHLAAEVLGSLFGKWPAGRYWTNTTYKLWGPEFIATMHKYAPANDGLNYHIVQAGYVGINFFGQAAKAIGPNLTRQRLMAELGDRSWKTDTSLDQRFSYVPSERTGDNWNREGAQGREFMYKYTSPNTVSNPDGTPNGWQPDPDQFVIRTDR